MFVRTQEGPRNTSSSMMIPSYMETLFCILTLLPMTTPPATMVFWPRLQPAPIFAPAQTWLKCQMRVPSPISHGSSMTTVGWMLSVLKDRKYLPSCFNDIRQTFRADWYQFAVLLQRCLASLQDTKHPDATSRIG